MKKIIFTSLILMAICQVSLSQDRELYSKLIDEAWQLYQNEEYLNSAQTYSEAFIVLGHKGYVRDRYNAACSWALANQPDSSFVQLFRIAEKGNYTNLRHIATDPDLTTLHDDKRWGEVISLVEQNKAKAEENLDKELVAILDTIYQEDQKYRRQIDEIEEKHGWESDEMKAHWELINEKDSLNLIKVKNILDNRGWLGFDVIGKRGNSTLFLVIQHSDLETQEHYLPMMREAVQKGNASASSLALLEDRVALRKGNKQIYGSQIGRDPESGNYYVLPMIAPDHVDKRRAEVGLSPIQEYVSRWGITWDAEKYKKNLPDYLDKQK